MIPGHFGNSGNETADAQAKLAIDSIEEHSYEVGVHEFLPAVRKACLNQFDNIWTAFNRPTNLKAIKHKVGHWDTSVRRTRRGEIVLCRLRLGHTRHTHSFILDQEPRPECAACHCPITVKHFLLECPTYRRQRRTLADHCHRSGVPLNLVSLLGDGCPSVIDELMLFLHECDLFRKI